MSIPALPPVFGVCSDAHLHNWSAFSKTQPDGSNDRLGHILHEIMIAAFNTRKLGGNRLYITGDLFHVRGSVSPTVLNMAIDCFRAICDGGFQVRILSGNHDLESRDSEKLSSACETLRTIPGVEVISEPQWFADDQVVMIPWYDSMDKVRELVQSHADDLLVQGEDPSEWTLMLHVPLNGVLAGIPDHGFYAAELAKYGFKWVFCGHYHAHKQFAGNVVSVGATTHQTWNDVDTLAGHLVVDDTRLAFFESSAPKFVDYDLSWDDDTAIERCAKNYIRVRLGSATDEEVTMIRDHVVSLGAAGCVVQAIPTPKTAATVRTTSAAAAPTTRQSINDWITSNSTYGEPLEKLCASIMDEVEGVTL